MGVFSSKYRFHLDGKDWCIHMRVGWYGWKCTATIDKTVIADLNSKGESCVSMLRGTTFDVVAGGREYEVQLAPVSVWDYGVHVYRDDKFIYRHKDRNFISLRKHEKFFGKIDDLENMRGGTRPFWKQFVEALIYGLAIGVTGSVVQNYLEAKNVISSGIDLTPWLIVFAMLFILFLPAKLRLIK